MARIFFSPNWIDYIFFGFRLSFNFSVYFNLFYFFFLLLLLFFKCQKYYFRLESCIESVNLIIPELDVDTTHDSNYNKLFMLRLGSGQLILTV